MKTYQIVISNQAKGSLKNIVKYIKKDSPTAAEYVRNALFALMENLKTSPQKFPLEPLLASLSKEYHSVVKWHYKIIYRVTTTEVIILDVIHTSRNPDTIKQIIK